MALKMSLTSRSANDGGERGIANNDYHNPNNVVPFKECEREAMLPKTRPGECWVPQSEGNVAMEASMFQSFVGEMTAPTGDYSSVQANRSLISAPTGHVSATNCRVGHHPKQQQRTWLQHAHLMNSSTSQPVGDEVTCAAGTASNSSFPSSVLPVPHQRRQQHPSFQTSTHTNEPGTCTRYSGFTQPIYGPSIPIKHPQFIDLSTDTSYMTAFELPEAQDASWSESTPASVDTLRAARKEGCAAAPDIVGSEVSLEDPSIAAVSHNSTSGIDPQPSHGYSTRQQRQQHPALPAVRELTLWAHRAISSQPPNTTEMTKPQLGTQFHQVPEGQPNEANKGGDERSKAHPVAVVKKTTRVPAQCDVFLATATRSLSPNCAVKRRGVATANAAPPLGLDGTPLQQITKLRADSHQPHTNTSIFSSFMGMTRSTKTVTGTPMAHDTRSFYHSHSEGDEDDARTSLNSKPITPQARRTDLFNDDNNSGAGIPNSSTHISGSLSDSNATGENAELSKQSLNRTTTELNGVMQKLLHHIQMKKSIECKSATNVAKVRAFYKGGGSASQMDVSFASTYSVPKPDAFNIEKPDDTATSQAPIDTMCSKTEPSPGSRVESSRQQSSQRSKARKNSCKENCQSSKQKSQHSKRTNQVDMFPVAPTVSPLPQQAEPAPIDDTLGDQRITAKSSGGPQGHTNVKEPDQPDSVVNRSLQDCLMASMRTVLQTNTIDVTQECKNMASHQTTEPQLSYPENFSSTVSLPNRVEDARSLATSAGSCQQRERGHEESALFSQQFDTSKDDRKNYSLTLEGHMQQRFVALSCVPHNCDTCVLFEGDRGVDMGRVITCEETDGKTDINSEIDSRIANDKVKKKRSSPQVLRAATQDEQDDWLFTQVDEAQKTIQPCRDAVKSLGLPLTIVNAVYQYNRQKLTFYYESDMRVDFRPLLQMMFSKFYCRIWMERVTPMLPAATTNDKDRANDGSSSITEHKN